VFHHHVLQHLEHYGNSESWVSKGVENNIQIRSKVAITAFTKVLINTIRKPTSKYSSLHSNTGPSNYKAALLLVSRITASRSYSRETEQKNCKPDTIGVENTLQREASVSCAAFQCGMFRYTAGFSACSPSAVPLCGSVIGNILLCWWCSNQTLSDDCGYNSCNADERSKFNWTTYT
jgi:hypothetical protein